MDRNIKFEADVEYRSRRSQRTSGMLYFLMKNKIVKNKTEANIVLLCIALFLLIATLFIVVKEQNVPEPVDEPDPDTLIGSH